MCVGVLSGLLFGHLFGHLFGNLFRVCAWAPYLGTFLGSFSGHLCLGLFFGHLFFWALGPYGVACTPKILEIRPPTVPTHARAEISQSWKPLTGTLCTQHLLRQVRGGDFVPSNRVCSAFTLVCPSVYFTGANSFGRAHGPMAQQDTIITASPE